MQFAPASMPCIRCRTVKVKTGGVTGMCSACRTADPAMADVQRENHRQMKLAMGAWLSKNTEPVPGRPGLHRAKRGARI